MHPYTYMIKIDVIITKEQIPQAFWGVVKFFMNLVFAKIDWSRYRSPIIISD